MIHKKFRTERELKIIQLTMTDMLSSSTDNSTIWMNATARVNVSTISHIGPPSPLLVDRIQLFLLVILFVIGAPINLISFTKLRQRRTMPRRIGRLRLLRLHLNISDLLILFVYTTSSICWQLTYKWNGGIILCKFVKFLNSTSFQLSSNIIVSVALDRLLTILFSSNVYRHFFENNRRLSSSLSLSAENSVHHAFSVKICILCSWVTAVGLNISQFWVWITVAPFTHIDPDWMQCVTVWSASKHFYRLTSTMAGYGRISQRQDDDKSSFFIDQLTYNLIQLAAVFWIPATVMVLIYSIVIIYLYILSAERKLSARRDKKIQLGQSGFDRRNTMSYDEGTDKHDNQNTSEVLRTDRMKKDINHHHNSTKSNNYLLPVALHRMRNSAFRTGLLLVCAYLFCWTPYNVLALWQFFDDTGYRRYAIYMKFLNVLIVFNSVVNPFLYGTLKFQFPARFFRRLRFYTQDKHQDRGRAEEKRMETTNEEIATV